MSLLSRLFGGNRETEPKAPPETHDGYAIHPEPIKEGNRWRICARIEKEIGGEMKTHRLIRADMLDSEDDALAQSAAKARQMIDEQGDRIFD